MRIFSFEDYRDFLRDSLGIRRQAARGQLLKLSQAASIHPTVLSQVMTGKRNFTSEQAVAVADFLGLSKRDAKFFLLLVQKERAGTKRLRELVTEEIESLRKKSDRVSEVLPQASKLTEEQKAVFYSNWFYSGLRVLSSLPEGNGLSALAKRASLSPACAGKALEFLTAHGLCVTDGPNSFKPGPQSTHVGNDSPLVARHHGNWRVKAIEKHPCLDDRRELAYTSPMSLSASDVFRVRGLILDFIGRVVKVTDPSPSETAFCLNVDWFEF